MAIVNHSKVLIPTFADSCFVYTWDSMANGDVGQSLELPEHADRSAQISGSFGSGGSVSIEGSLDGATYFSLSDPQGNALDVTISKIETVTEIVRYIRPRVTSGDGTTALKIDLLVRRPFK